MVAVNINLSVVTNNINVRAVVVPVVSSNVVTLPSTDGSDAFVIKDKDGFPIFKFFSNGTLGMKGRGIKRL